MKRPFDNLFILSYGALGDFCVLLFFLNQAHEKTPHARYVVLTTRNASLLQKMAGQYPFVEIRQVNVFNIIQLFFSTLLKKKVFVMPPSFFPTPWFASTLARLLTFFRGMLAGFTSKDSNLSYDISVEFNTKDLFYKNFSRMLAELGIPTEAPFTLSFSQDMSALSSLSARYIVVAPFASHPGKSLPPERWVDILKFLNKEYPHYTLVLIGGPQDREVALDFIRQADHTNAQVLCGEPFAKTAAVIARTACFVGVDSGLTHIAGVMHVPTVAIENLRTVMWLPRYNPNAVILTEAKNCLCSADRGRDCYYEIGGIRYLRCMIDIPQENIKKAITETLQKND